MAKRTSIDFSDEDEAAIQLVMRRYGQTAESDAVRMCVRMVAHAKQMLLESPVIDGREREGQDA